MTRVDAVVVAYNSADRLRRLLPALHEDPSVGDVVVVDHGHDGSDQIARDIGAAHVLTDRANPGFGAGQNAGAKHASTKYLLMVNPDLLPSQGAVAAGAAFLDAHPRAAAVQGVIRSEGDGSPERSAGIVLTPVHMWGRLLRLQRLVPLPLALVVARRTRLLADYVDRVPTQACTVESLAATMIMMRRQAFEGVAGFDESFFLYGEDLDLSIRLRQAGWELWSLPETWALHASGESSGPRWNRELVWWEGTMRFGAIHWSRGNFLFAIVAALLRAGGLAMQRPSSASCLLRRLVAEPLRLRRRRR